MSAYPSKRQPLSLVHNRSNTSTAGSGSPGRNTTARKKVPSFGALTAVHTSPKPSLETGRNGRASLSFSSFEPYRLPPAAPSPSTPAGRSSGKGRARATTVSSASNLSACTTLPSAPSAAGHANRVRSPPRTVAALGPTRRTRSKTLSKSLSHAVSTSILNRSTHKRPLSQDEHSHTRRQSCSFLEHDNLQNTLDLLEQHAEEQGRRLCVPSSSGSNTANTSMLSAPLMQRSPITPAADLATASGTAYVPQFVSNANSTCNGRSHSSLSPPTLLPPYMPSTANLDLVFPSSSPRISLNSSTSSQSSSLGHATLTPQVEQLSNLISDLSLFLPQADSLSAEQLTAIQTAVDSLLGKPIAASSSGTSARPLQTSLNGNQIQNNRSNNTFLDGMPTFCVGGLSSSYHVSFDAAQNPYHPLTPYSAEMLDISTQPQYPHQSQSFKHHQGGDGEMIGLQVQHDPPPYEPRINFSNLDYDLGLAPPRW